MLACGKCLHVNAVSEKAVTSTSQQMQSISV